MSKFCPECGQSVKANEKICQSCGADLKKTGKKSSEPAKRISSMKEDDLTRKTGSFIWTVIGFLFPLVGLILFLVWQRENPAASLSAGKGALLGVIFYVVMFSFLATAAMFQGPGNGAIFSPTSL